MEYRNTGQPVKPKRSRLSLAIIVGTLAILMLILVTVVGLLVFTRQFGADVPGQARAILGTTPLNWLEIDKIDPALALASLGGVSEADVVAEAIDKARPETALSALVFSPTLTNKESAGGFLQLARSYAAENQKEKAVFSYKMACTLATLAPEMADTVRADMLLQAGDGLIALEEPDWAKFYLDQAFTLAAESPYLQAAHRRTIFERLQKNYIIIGQRALARQSLSLAANAPSPTRAAEEQTLLPHSSSVLLPATVQDAEAQRWQTAQELAILLVERGGQAPQSAIDALAEALIREDQAKLTFYQSELEKTTRVSKKIELTLAQINWLSIKYRVARQGFGISLVPAWEVEAEQIRADLTKRYEALFANYADLVIALPEAAQIDKATEERLRSEVLAGELGRYPNYPEEQRRKQLLDATEKLIETQSQLKIFVSIGAVNDEELYTLVSVE